MYLAGSFLMLLALLTVFGVLLSDIALAVLDPRIRFGAGHAR
jgi:peptide/nickel transport system permease protein